jgi:dUTP pyrophosphatase
MVVLQIAQVEGAEDVPLPAYATPGSAGLDLHAAVKGFIRLNPGERTLVPCGIQVAVPAGHSMDIQPRSGLALKQGIMVLNSPGLVDEDYRGEVGVILFNNGADTFVVRRGDRIAQAVIRPVAHANVIKVNKAELGTTQRGEGGFGSTGTQPQNEA